MKTKQLHKLRALALLLLLSLSGLITTSAQTTGTGVDPNAVMMDDFESGSTSKWTARPGTRGEKMTFDLMNASNGDLVKFGNHALRVNIDFTNAQANQTLTAQISPGTSGEALQIPGNAAGGKRLGMWVYATPGVQGMWMRVSTRPIGATSGVSNSDLASSINWTGWKYVQCDLPKGHEFHPDGIRFLVLKSNTNYFVNGYVIIDNIRVTNQSFTEDQFVPSISSLTGNGENLTGNFTTSQLNLSASFNEVGNPSSGLNYNSIFMAVDGYKFKAGDPGFSLDETNNTVSLSGMNLSNGPHSVIVNVEDNFGHVATRKGDFTVEATDGRSTIVNTVNPAEVKVGNPYKIKINTNNSKDVKELNIVLALNNIGSVKETGGVEFAASAQTGSCYSFNPRSGQLTISLKNDISAELTETLATINVEISKYSNPTDVLICSPVSAKAVYSDNSLSLFSLFKTFEKNVTADFKYSVLKRVVGAPGEVLVSNNDGSPLSGATVFVLNEDKTEVLTSAVTEADGIARNMSFTNSAQSVNIYAGKDNKYSFTQLVRTLDPLYSNIPSAIRAGSTSDPKTSKTITWVSNPVTSLEPAILKLAKKVDGESAFAEVTGKTKILEYNALLSNGIAKGNSVTLTNLEPGTTYIYQVGDGTNWSATHEFTTTSDSKKLSFSAFGDLQATSNDLMARFVAAAKTIEEMPERPWFNLNVGDIVDTDDRQDYYSYYGYLFNERPGFANIDMVAAYGNHEYMGNPDADNIKFVNGHHTVAPSANYNAEIVGTGSYASEYGNMLVIALDWAHKGNATVNEILTEQAKWLEDILSKTDKTWKIVTTHYPIYPYESTPGTQAIFGPIFDKYNVQLFLCGHGHTYERVQVFQGNNVVPPGDKRTFTPGIGGTMYFQLGDMTRSTANGRWIHCAVNGKEMKVTSRDANENIVANECFTLYASPMSNYGVTFSTVNQKGALTASVEGEEITSGKDVKEGKSVVFKAIPNDGHKVKEWKVNNKVIDGHDANEFTLHDLAEASHVTVEFDAATGTEESLESRLKVYPNPFADQLTLSGADGCSLRIVDVAGTVILNKEIYSSHEQINLNQLTPGVYFCHIQKDKQAKVVKVVKK